MMVKRLHSYEFTFQRQRPPTCRKYGMQINKNTDLEWDLNGCIHQGVTCPDPPPDSSPGKGQTHKEQARLA